MPRRLAVLCALAFACSVGVASASSLGGLTASAGATVVQAGDVQCTVVDPASDVTFHAGLLGTLSNIPLADLDLPGLVTYIGIADLSGACADTRPVVVVVGRPSALAPEQVLSRTLLGPLSGTSPVFRSVAAGDEVNTLIGPLAEATEVRIAFCPVGEASCEP